MGTAEIQNWRDSCLSKLSTNTLVPNFQAILRILESIGNSIKIGFILNLAILFFSKWSLLLLGVSQSHCSCGPGILRLEPRNLASGCTICLRAGYWLQIGRNTPICQKSMPSICHLACQIFKLCFSETNWRSIFRKSQESVH